MLVIGMVLGVTTKSAMEELEHVLGDIRDVGTALGLSNSNRIKLSNIKSVMSDQASTQKLFNRMLQQKIDDSVTSEQGIDGTSDGSGEEVSHMNTVCNGDDSGYSGTGDEVSMYMINDDYQ